MKIVVSKLFETELKNILEELAQQDYALTKQFKMYLDTIIMNLPTKVKKYKKSIYFDNENIKDIEYQGCTIVFYIDEENDSYVILGITKKS